MEKKLGKIGKVTFGHGGYDGVMLGMDFTFEGDSWGVGYSKSFWDSEKIKHTDSCKWSELDRDKYYADIMKYLSKLLKQAKVSDVNDLKDIPVEVTFENNMLKDWRILTEVL